MSRLARQETMVVALTASSFSQQVKFSHSKFKYNLSDTSFKCLKYNHTNTASIPFTMPIVLLGTSWLWIYSHVQHTITFMEFTNFPSFQNVPNISQDDIYTLQKQQLFSIISVTQRPL
jgi:hypothetical protein